MVDQREHQVIDADKRKHKACDRFHSFFAADQTYNECKECCEQIDCPGSILTVNRDDGIVSRFTDDDDHLAAHLAVCAKKRTARIDRIIFLSCKCSCLYVYADFLRTVAVAVLREIILRYFCNNRFLIGLSRRRYKRCFFKLIDFY